MDIAVVIDGVLLENLGFTAKGYTAVDSTLKKILIGAGVGVTAFLAVKLLLSAAFWLALLAGLIGGALAIVLIARSQGDDPKKTLRAAVDEAKRTVKLDPAREHRQAAENLLLANTGLRMAKVDAGLLTKSEAVIDTVLDMLPRAIDFDASCETTYNLKSLAIRDLPTLIRDFTGLTESDRAKHLVALQNQLDELALKLKKLSEFIELGNRHEFTTSATFLNVKFA